MKRLGFYKLQMNPLPHARFTAQIIVTIAPTASQHLHLSARPPGAIDFMDGAREIALCAKYGTSEFEDGDFSIDDHELCSSRLPTQGLF